MEDRSIENGPARRRGEVCYQIALPKTDDFSAPQIEVSGY
jgi:hypothetical protein